MRKERPYYRLVEFGMFPYQILFATNVPLLEVEKYIAKEFKTKVFHNPENPFEESERAGKFIHLPTGQSILWMKDAPKTPISIANLAHECLHAVMQIYNTMGVPLDYKNDEIFAYTLEYLMTIILEDFKSK